MAVARERLRARLAAKKVYADYALLNHLTLLMLTTGTETLNRDVHQAFSMRDLQVRDTPEGAAVEARKVYEELSFEEQRFYEPYRDVVREASKLLSRLEDY